MEQRPVIADALVRAMIGDLTPSHKARPDEGRGRRHFAFRRRQLEIVQRRRDKTIKDDGTDEFICALSPEHPDGHTVDRFGSRAGGVHVSIFRAIKIYCRPRRALVVGLDPTTGAREWDPGGRAVRVE